MASDKKENDVNVIDLGIDQNELREQVIDRAATKLAKYLSKQEDAFEPVRNVVLEVVQAEASRIADEVIRPWVASGVEGVVLQRTTEWGEKKGEPVTFRQYLIERAEAYLKEPVNYEGKNRAEARDSYNWNNTQARIAWMIDKHLHYEIERAMKSALESANKAIVGGIEDTIKTKLAEVSKALTLTVKAK